ncbi:FAD/NAD(P)-binding protein [Alteromonas facilis]|uniref:FAD/NAD(P)-binding protein n=1 Tax=Alteromonas facilis TaxID=2048004 RepID=UPI000C28846C|nr:FAD/NAD(P)-binding protein [Alteromonas facilis]
MTSFVPMQARIVDKSVESPGLETLHLAMDQTEPFAFHFGQFNMLSVMGIGEIPISIMGWQDGALLHTIRSVGRVSEAILQLPIDTHVGLRGPFGQGWPLEHFEGRDLVFITAGLGCAPVVAAINFAVTHRNNYRRIVILQGVKHHNDLLWQPKYDAWREMGDCQVLLAASEEKKQKHQWKLGMVTALLDDAEFDPSHCAVMICGPEIMMLSAMPYLQKRNVRDDDIYLSMERNFQCGQGLCGHCQLGPFFVCKDGPVFRYSDVKPWLGVRGI